MRTILLISLIFIVGASAIAIFFYSNLPFAHYDLEIRGMKDTYQIGEEYSFYYTITGYGNTCHSWVVSFPDKNGEIQHRGEAVDCFRPDNKQLDYDSRTDLREFSSKVPTIEGKYNVTVSLENIDPVVYEFTVIEGDLSTQSNCPAEFDTNYESRRRIISCGANPPQAKFSFMDLNGIKSCKKNDAKYYYMYSGDNATITYSYEITENKRNPDEIFELKKDAHFLCKIQDDGYKACIPDDIHVTFDTETEFIKVGEPQIIIANIQIDKDAHRQDYLLHMTPNICANPNLPFSVLTGK